MSGFRLFADPWWVNLLILVPFVSFYYWRRTGLAIVPRTLLAAAAFGIAFGFVEAAVVVYLRAALGLIAPGGGAVIYPPPLQTIPHHLLATEMTREAATMVMLVAVAFVAARRARERWAIFLLVFALWDIFYYVGLRALIGWPHSLVSNDILYLIPVPWISNVWYPILVSGSSVVAVVYATMRRPDMSPAASEP